MAIRTILILFFSGCISEDPAPSVHLLLGKLEGYIKETITGKKILSFEGVPYAQPPVGQHRFKVNYFHRSLVNNNRSFFAGSWSSETLVWCMESCNGIQMLTVWSFHTSRCWHGFRLESRLFDTSLPLP